MDHPDSDDPDGLEDTPTPTRHPTAAELRRHRRTVPRGTPILPALDDAPVHDPDDVETEWPAAADPRDAEILRRAGRDPTEPAMPAEITAIVRRLRRELREELQAVAQDPKALGELRTELEALRREFEPHRKFGRWVAGIAGAALLAVGVFLYHRGADEQHVTDEIRRVDEKVDRCLNQISKDTKP